MAWLFEDNQPNWTFDDTGEPVQAGGIIGEGMAEAGMSMSSTFQNLVSQFIEGRKQAKERREAAPIASIVLEEMDPYAVQREYVRSSSQFRDEFMENLFGGPGGRLASAGRAASFAILPSAGPAVRGLTRKIPKASPMAEAVAKADLPPLLAAADATPHINAVLETHPPPRFQGPMMTANRAKEIEMGVARALPGELQGVSLSAEVSQKVIDVAEDVFRTTGIQRDHGIPVTIQVVRDINARPELYASVLRPLLEKSGLTVEQFGEVFAATKSTAGRQLNQLAQLAKKMESVPELSELSQALARARDPLTGWDVASHFWGRFINVWRGSLVTAWSTAIRNFTTQAARLGMESVETLLDIAVRNVTRTGTAADRQLTPAFREIMEQWHTLVSRGKQKQAMNIIEAFPDETTRLFNRFSSDINVSSALEAGEMGAIGRATEAAFNKAEKALNVVNFANKGQEFLIRRAAFRAKLSAILEKKGLNIDLVSPAQIDPTDIAKAVDHSLDMTFAVSPKSGIAKSFMEIYENPIGKTLSFMAPFPRYFYNSLKFNFEYSPAAFLKLLSKAERSKIASGDVRLLSKILVGAGMQYVAYEIRNNPELAGEKYYEIKAGDKRIDARPFGPFALYLLIAELEKAWREDRPIPEIKDIIQSAAALNFRAGAGLYLLDTATEAVGALLADPSLLVAEVEKPSRVSRKVAGEIAGGFFQPLTTYRELFADYGKFLGEKAGQLAEEEAKLREIREHPFTGPILRRIPLLSQTLPEKELPLSADVPRQNVLDVGFVKLSRQITGLSAQTRNRIEAEANRLGLTFAELNPRTGEPKADRLIAKHMGPLAETFLTPAVSSGAYQRLDDAARRVIFTKLVSRIKEDARRRAIVEDPELFAKMKFRQAVPRRTRELLEQRGVIPERLRR